MLRTGHPVPLSACLAGSRRAPLGVQKKALWSVQSTGRAASSEQGGTYVQLAGGALGLRSAPFATVDSNSS